MGYLHHVIVVVLLAADVSCSTSTSSGACPSGQIPCVTQTRTVCIDENVACEADNQLFTVAADLRLSISSASDAGMRIWTATVSNEGPDTAPVLVLDLTAPSEDKLTVPSSCDQVMPNLASCSFVGLAVSEARIVTFQIARGDAADAATVPFRYLRSTLSCGVGSQVGFGTICRDAALSNNSVLTEL